LTVIDGDRRGRVLHDRPAVDRVAPAAEDEAVPAVARRVAEPPARPQAHAGIGAGLVVRLVAGLHLCPAHLVGNPAVTAAELAAEPVRRAPVAISGERATIPGRSAADSVVEPRLVLAGFAVGLPEQPAASASYRVLDMADAPARLAAHSVEPAAE